MTNELQSLLQISASLYAQLAELPDVESRDSYIEELNSKLAIREKAIADLLQKDFQFNPLENSHSMLFELDKGIKERLESVLTNIKNDLKDLQNAKKNEKQYSNPYGHVQTMDGMYYDKKK